MDDQTERSATTVEPEARRIHRSGRLVVSGLIGVAVIGLALVAAGVVWDSRRDTVAVPAPHSEPPQNMAAVPAVVVVHVSGAVLTPGLVQLDEGARVIEAIEAAGGALDDSGIHLLNLARPLIDGEHIVVPRAGDEPQSATNEGPISLSRSTAERLQELPGVGPAIADRIIRWREENGPFTTLEDVLAVSGIGQATLEQLQGLAVP